MGLFFSSMAAVMLKSSCLKVREDWLDWTSSQWRRTLQWADCILMPIKLFCHGSLWPVVITLTFLSQSPTPVPSSPFTIPLPTPLPAVEVSLSLHTLIFLLCCRCTVALHACPIFIESQSKTMNTEHKHWGCCWLQTAQTKCFNISILLNWSLIHWLSRAVPWQWWCLLPIQHCDHSLVSQQAKRKF